MRCTRCPREDVTLAEAQAAAARIIEAGVLTSGGLGLNEFVEARIKVVTVTVLAYAMDTKEIFSAVGNFGFPMVLSWYLLLRMEQRLDKLTSCLNELSRALLQKNKEV